MVGDQTLGRSTVANDWGAILNLESILRLKMVYVYFPAIVLKMTSRTQAEYGKLTNV
jgi:hypothetical protein